MPIRIRHARTFIGLILVAAMAATRFHHLGDALHLPDASWALFFLAGVYLSPAWLLVLMAEATLIDGAAIGWLGVSSYCLTPAYAGLLLAYLLLWSGGRQAAGAGLGGAAGAALSSTLLAFLVSNGSFYWVGGRVAEPSLAGFVQTCLDYGPSFIVATLLYLGLAAIIHGVLAAPGRGRRVLGSSTGR